MKSYPKSTSNFGIQFLCKEIGNWSSLTVAKPDGILVNIAAGIVPAKDAKNVGDR